MRRLLKVVTLLDRWTKRLEETHSECGLVGCSGPKTRWARFLHHRSGTYLQGMFYCQRQCLETALTAQLARLHAIAPPARPSNRIPLGLLMVARGWLTYEQVVTALAAQQSAGSGQIGEWFEKLGFATEQQVTSALGLQWGCPVTSSLDSAAVAALGRIPLGIMEAFQMLPLHFVPATKTIYVAFGQRVDHAALYAIEKLLDCRTQPCVAGRKIIADELVRMRQQPRPRELEFGPMHDFADIGRVSVSYMLRLGADEARLARVGPFIWLRLRVQTAYTDLLFRLGVKAPAVQKALNPALPLSLASALPAVPGGEAILERPLEQRHSQ
jgi:hypothetical protein